MLTAFGPTHVVACGPRDAPPLVLLHGMCMGAPMWFPNVAAWSEGYRVYAPDTIGDMGRSLYTLPPRRPGDYVAWLSDVLDALGVVQTCLLGLSFGGFVAATMAMHAPQRVRHLVLFGSGWRFLPAADAILPARTSLHGVAGPPHPAGVPRLVPHPRSQPTGTRAR